MNQAKIILVDDDDALLNCTSELLADAGYTVYPFNNGRDALIRFQEEPVDLVLTDIKMPIMTGIELLEKIRAFDQDSPVLLMTGYENSETKPEYFDPKVIQAFKETSAECAEIFENISNTIGDYSHGN